VRWCVGRAMLQFRAEAEGKAVGRTRMARRESTVASRFASTASAMARRAGLALLAVMVRQVIGASMEWTLEPEDASRRRELLQPTFMDDAFLADSFQSPVRAPGRRWRASQCILFLWQARSCPA
jgi:hypothetical protein